VASASASVVVVVVDSRAINSKADIAAQSSDLLFVVPMGSGRDMFNDFSGER